MIKIIDKNKQRLKKHLRVRKNISGTATRPRLCVFRSNKYIYAQVIDDVKGVTLVASSSLEAAIKQEVAEMTGMEIAKTVGLAVGKKAIEAGITEVVYDRGGYVYTGKVKALADGAREAGLKF